MDSHLKKSTCKSMSPNAGGYCYDARKNVPRQIIKVGEIKNKNNEWLIGYPSDYFWICPNEFKIPKGIKIWISAFLWFFCLVVGSAIFSYLWYILIELSSIVSLITKEKVAFVKIHSTVSNSAESNPLYLNEIEYLIKIKRFRMVQIS